jgi:hypothetical protein
MSLTHEQAKHVREFAQAILHGDDTHKEWLLEAAECFVDGRALPPARSGPRPWPSKQ